MVNGFHLLLNISLKRHQRLCLDLSCNALYIPNLLNEDIASYILKVSMQLSSLNRRELIFFASSDSSYVRFHVLICIDVELREISDIRHIKATLSPNCLCL